jgi:hypothetical protein
MNTFRLQLEGGVEIQLQELAAAQAGYGGRVWASSLLLGQYLVRRWELAVALRDIKVIACLISLKWAHPSAPKS